jgi:hypothetical protein
LSGTFPGGCCCWEGALIAAAVYTASTGTPSLVENATTPEMAAISHGNALRVGGARHRRSAFSNSINHCRVRAQLEEALQKSSGEGGTGPAKGSRTAKA